MWPLFGEVAPPPEVLIPPDAGVAEALGGLLGWLAGLLRPVRDAIVTAVKWVIHIDWEALQIAWHFTQDLNVAVSVLRSWATSEVQGLVRAVSAIHPSTIVQVTSSAAADLSKVYETIDGAEHYAISVAEDLYNRAESDLSHVQDYLFHTAYQWVISAETNAQDWVAGLRSYVGDLHNLVWSHVDEVERTLNDTVSQAQSAVVGYVDGVVGGVERDLGDLRKYADAAVAGVGAAVFARVITTVKDLYDPCCEFTTDQVKPQWDRVKSLLGKLTRRGPLALVVLGAASEAVVALDRPTIVAMLKQARADDGGTSLAVLHDWRRAGVA